MTNVEPREPRAAWSRPRRMTAVLLWCSFWTALLSTMLLLFLPPAMDVNGHYTMETLTLWFLLSWALATAPMAFLVLLLATPGRGPRTP